MRTVVRVILWVVVLAGIGLWAQTPDEILEELPTKLKLPPGLDQTLPLNKTASFFGDVLHAVDCAEDKDLPYGTCGNQLFGGQVMTDSHLNGNLRIRFFPPVNDVAHFEVIHGTLHGDDGVLQSPQGYELPVLRPEVGDAPLFLSNGDLDLRTGGVANLKYYVLLRNSAIDILLDANPKIDRPVVVFPGIRGSVWARFEQRPDGLLDFTFRGSTFLALGRDAQGETIRFPMPYCNPLHCANIPARGTSLHPHLYLSTKEPEGPECAPNCPDIPVNTIREFTVVTASSSFGDDFDLHIPQLGGAATGRSHLLGRLQIQFGPWSGDTVSFVIQSMVPEGLLANPPKSPFGPGFVPSLLGQDEFLRFPLITYRLKKVALVDEPFDIIHGAVNLKTGRVIGEMPYPSFFVQDLALALFEQNDGRISPDAFPVKVLKKLPSQPQTTYGLFEKGVNGQLVFRFSGEHKRTFFTYRFPSPDLVKGNSFLALSPFAELDLFLRIQAVQTVDTPRVRKTGAETNVLSSIGDRFSYSYSIPCNPAGESFSFEYTNFNPGTSGGTFRMNRLAAVHCVNSRTSTLPPGDYDTVTFSGFGTWSKDKPDSAPRFVTGQISTSPQLPYVGILVFQNPDKDDNPILSSANIRPAEKPLP
ncbi:MAG: hypothetical protein A3J28_10430 [Acidobacteria bacterium RIFCSPLOWO2_12_FULL_60_22]|nr:MAG: hypothetical protein A3J28_10430 [Acidobacteria bacterium RIFCSPLOWO2_12_FULL_60_22]